MQELENLLQVTSCELQVNWCCGYHLLCHDFIHRQYLLPMTNCKNRKPLFFYPADDSIITVYQFSYGLVAGF